MLQVVTIGKIKGGSAFNVIPDSVTIGGTFRAFSKHSFLQLRRRIEEVSLQQLVTSKLAEMFLQFMRRYAKYTISVIENAIT